MGAVDSLLDDDSLHTEFAKLPAAARAAFNWQLGWLQQAHKHQIEPPGDWWNIWLLMAGRGAGKQLCVDTPIPTISGWKRNGDLKAGDIVFDEMGKMCRVVQAHPITMPKTAYRLTFSDGSVIDADGEHLWTTLTHRARKQMTRHGIKSVPQDWASYKHPLIDCHHNVVGMIGAETLTTEQIRQTFTHSARKDLNHCIPTSQPLDLPEAVLPVDPYLLGSWLGDGSSSDQVIWGHIDDIGLIEAHAQSLGYETSRKHDRDSTWCIRIQGLARKLTALGVFKNKHVPAIYLRASIEQRLSLLQGLMDTDGYQDAKAAEFCNTNRRLAEAVYELAVSLGEKPVMKESRAMLKGRDCGEKYRVTWRWNRFNPFRMGRKASRMSAPSGQAFKHGHRMIVSIEPIAPKPMRCITVDSPSRLYLAGEAMIPTHNTRAAAETIGSWAWDQPNTRWLVSAPTSGDIRGTCFEGESGLLEVIPKDLVADYNKSLHELKLTNGSFLKGIPASEPERFRGGQWHGAWCLPAGTMILMADGSQKPVEQVQSGESVQTRFGSYAVTFSGLSGNPNALVSIECGDTRLTLTEDHPILVGDRWIPAGQIKKGDFVWVATSALAANTLTEQSTSNTMAQSQKDGLSITRTKTSATTILQTLKQCLDQNISSITLRDVQGLIFNAKQRVKHWKDCVVQRMQPALTAVRDLFLAPLVRSVNSVPVIALSNGGEINSCQRNGTALSVGMNTPQSRDSRGTAARSVMPSQLSAPIGLRQAEVRHVERFQNYETFNLTVDVVNEYIANGLVVHNCDELAAWEYLQDSWDMIQFAVRLGKKTRIIASTTPKPKPLIMDLLGREGDDVVVTRASTYVNVANLAPSFQKQILQYEGTKLGRQEIHAEIIDPEEGGIVKREWFRLWPDGKPFPRLEFVIQSYDCATSDKTVNDPTGCITMGVFKPDDGAMSVIVLDCWQEHLTYPDLRPKVIKEFDVAFGEGNARKLVDLVLVEDKSAGISLIQDLQRAHLPVHAYNPGRADKVQRLSIVANIIKAGRVWVPESSKRKGFVRDWAEGMVSQICSFPEGTEHDEFVDCISQALRYLRDGGWISIDLMPRDVSEQDITDAEMYNMRLKQNPYSA